MPTGERRIVRARPDRLVKIFKAFVRNARKIRGPSRGWRRRARRDGSRASARSCSATPLLGSAPGTEGSYLSSRGIQAQSGSRARAFRRSNSWRPAPRSPLGSLEPPSAASMKNWFANPIRALTLLGSMASACSQSAYAASASLPIDPAFQWARLALEGQVFGVAIGRGNPFETVALGSVN